MGQRKEWPLAVDFEHDLLVNEAADGAGRRQTYREIAESALGFCGVFTVVEFERVPENRGVTFGANRKASNGDLTGFQGVNLLRGKPGAYLPLSDANARQWHGCVVLEFNQNERTLFGIVDRGFNFSVKCRDEQTINRYDPVRRCCRGIHHQVQVSFRYSMISLSLQSLPGTA